MRLSREGGLKALKQGKRGRRPGGRRLNGTQAACIRALIVGKMPDQLKLPFYLWTRETVAQLIAREYDITVSPTTVRRYLKAWGLSAQKLMRRVYERNDVAIARWLDEAYSLYCVDDCVRRFRGLSTCLSQRLTASRAINIADSDGAHLVARTGGMLLHEKPAHDRSAAWSCNAPALESADSLVVMHDVPQRHHGDTHIKNSSQWFQK